MIIKEHGNGCITFWVGRGIVGILPPLVFGFLIGVARDNVKAFVPFKALFYKFVLVHKKKSL
jgi:hypothetical protein